MSYEVYPVEWLDNHIADWKPFFELLKPFFKHGGMLAGGALRRAIERGNFYTVFTSEKEWKIFVEREYRQNQFDSSGKFAGVKVVVKMGPEPRYVDTDFYFRNAEDFEKTAKFFDRKYITNYTSFKDHWGHVKAGNPDDNKEPFNYAPLIYCYHKLEKLFFPANLVYLHFGKPEEILDTFDFRNCKIITDGKQVWVHPDMLFLEKENILKLDGSTNTRTLSRVKKYLASKDYSKFFGREILMEPKYRKWIEHKIWNQEYVPEEVFWDKRIFSEADILLILRKNMDMMRSVLMTRRGSNKQFPVIKQVDRKGSPLADHPYGHASVYMLD